MKNKQLQSFWLLANKEYLCAFAFDFISAKTDLTRIHVAANDDLIVCIVSNPKLCQKISNLKSQRVPSESFQDVLETCSIELLALSFQIFTPSPHLRHRPKISVSLLSCWLQLHAAEQELQPDAEHEHRPGQLHLDADHWSIPCLWSSPCQPLILLGPVLIVDPSTTLICSAQVSSWCWCQCWCSLRLIKVEKRKYQGEVFFFFNIFATFLKIDQARKWKIPGWGFFLHQYFCTSLKDWSS